MTSLIIYVDVTWNQRQHPTVCYAATYSKQNGELSLTILRKKLCFTQFSTRKAPCLLLIFFICLHNQLSSIHSIMTFKEYRCLRKVIHQIYNKNEWLLLSARFTTELELAFVLTLEKTFSQRFHLKANRKSIGSSKKRN